MLEPYIAVGMGGGRVGNCPPSKKGQFQPNIQKISRQKRRKEHFVVLLDLVLHELVFLKIFNKFPYDC